MQTLILPEFHDDCVTLLLCKMQVSSLRVVQNTLFCNSAYTQVA